MVLALIPGVSRSGGTIIAGLLLDYRREEAAKYSFLLAIPAVLGAGFLELTKIGEGRAPEWGGFSQGGAMVQTNQRNAVAFLKKQHETVRELCEVAGLAAAAGAGGTAPSSSR